MRVSTGRSGKIFAAMSGAFSTKFNKKEASGSSGLGEALAILGRWRRV